MPGSLNIVLGNNFDIHDNPSVTITIDSDGRATVKKESVPVVTSECSDVVETSAEEDPARVTLPECLSTPAAKRIWHRLQSAALIDDHYQPVGLFRWQSILLANAMAEKLDISRKWKTFESLWGMSSMRQGLQTAMQNAGAAEFYKKLKAVGV